MIKLSKIQKIFEYKKCEDNYILLSVRYSLTKYVIPDHSTHACMLVCIDSVYSLPL